MDLVEAKHAVDYPEYVRQMHSNQDYMFTEEFAVSDLTQECLVIFYSCLTKCCS